MMRALPTKLQIHWNLSNNHHHQCQAGGEEGEREWRKQRRRRRSIKIPSQTQTGPLSLSLTASSTVCLLHCIGNSRDHHSQHHGEGMEFYRTKAIKKFSHSCFELLKSLWSSMHLKSSSMSKQIVKILETVVTKPQSSQHG